MNEDTLIGAGLFLLGLAYLAALFLATLLDLRRPPRAFLLLLAAASCVSGIGLGLAVVAGGDGPFGVTTETWAIAFVFGQLLGLTGFILSQGLVVWQQYGQARKEDASVSGKLDKAAKQAEDRFSEGELEKIEVRERVDRAAVVSRGELRETEKKILASIEALRAMLKKEEKGG